jgi:hypothetical protein
MSRILILILLTLIISNLGAIAQEEEPPTVITAENLNQLVPLATVDFADGFVIPVLPPVNGDAPTEPPEVVTPVFNTGRFVMNRTGDAYAVYPTDNTVRVVNADGEQTLMIEPPINADDTTAIPVDAAFGDFTIPLPLFALYQTATGYAVVPDDGQIYGSPFTTLLVEDEDALPQEVWAACDGESYYDCAPWVLVGRDRLAVAELPSQMALDTQNAFAETQTLTDMDYRPYGPDSEENVLIRVGRVEAPTVITASDEGSVNRWNLEADEITVQGTVEGGPAVFGQVSANDRYFAWRDPMSEALHLLDFDSGESQQIAELNGDYAQFFLVTDTGDLIFAVHLNDEPVVIAWDTATGDRYNLGEYRECSRELDMARLSDDGATLAIGCDTGLELWRVGE